IVARASCRRCGFHHFDASAAHCGKHISIAAMVSRHKIRSRAPAPLGRTAQTPPGTTKATSKTSREGKTERSDGQEVGGEEKAVETCGQPCGQKGKTK